MGKSGVFKAKVLGHTLSEMLARHGKLFEIFAVDEEEGTRFECIFAVEIEWGDETLTGTVNDFQITSSSEQKTKWLVLECRGPGREIFAFINLKTGEIELSLPNV